MKHRFERRYGRQDLHFITCSCYRRLPLLRSKATRTLLLLIPSSVRDRYDFALLGYVVMPEHIHLLISEPRVGTPSTVMQVLKQRVSRAARRRKRRRAPPGQMRFWNEAPVAGHRRFWQRRFYDFNVWTRKKRNEKMNYMHFHPVKRGLVAHPKDWLWSSYRFYAMNEPGVCPPNPEWILKPRKAASPHAPFCEPKGCGTPSGLSEA